jgi:hypothetical protein
MAVHNNYTMRYLVSLFMNNTSLTFSSLGERLLYHNAPVTPWLCVLVPRSGLVAPPQRSHCGSNSVLIYPQFFPSPLKMAFEWMAYGLISYAGIESHAKRGAVQSAALLSLIMQATTTSDFPLSRSRPFSALRQHRPDACL